MQTSEQSFIANINFISTQFNRYFSIFIFIFGTVGNILNILVLAQKTFRTNSCAFLFMFSSMANLVVIISGLPSRMLSGWDADLSATNRIVCKLRAVVLNVSRPIAFWLILLAAIDRWLLSSSNNHLRQMSSLKNAKRATIVISLSSTIIFAHTIYCNEPNQLDAPIRCYGATITCRIVTDTCFTFITTLIPLILMLIFGLLTIRNVRQARNRAHPGAISTVSTGSNPNGNPGNSQKRTEYRLLVMLVVQVFVFLLLGLPLGIEKLVETFTVHYEKSASQKAIDKLLYGILQQLNFLSNGIPFYIYTLVGGTIFRRALVKLFVPGASTTVGSTNVIGPAQKRPTTTH